MRLIDIENLALTYSGLAYICPFDYEGITKYFCNQLLNLTPIDPETLPIVQMLRKQLKKVTLEKNKAIDVLENVCMYGDSPCKYCTEKDKCDQQAPPDCCRNFMFNDYVEVQHE